MRRSVRPRPASPIDGDFDPARWRRLAFAIVCVAICVRAIWAMAVPVVPVSDSVAYDTFASNLANGDGYGWRPESPTAYWPVGTSAMYALLYAMFGHVYWPIVFFNIVLGVGIVALSSRLISGWFGPRAGLAGGALLAVWPGQVQFTTVLASELPFQFVVLATVWFWSERSRSFWTSSLALGVGCAAASYLRPIALLLPAVLVTTRPPAISPGRRFAVFSSAVVLMLVLIAPWCLRNRYVLGEFVLISTNGGTNLWMGNNPGSTGRYMPIPERLRQRRLGEVKRGAELRDEALRYIRSDPLGFAGRSLRKLVQTHSRETIGVAWNVKGLSLRFGDGSLLPLKIVSTAFWWLVLGASLVGLVWLVRDIGWWYTLRHPCVLVWFYFTVVHAVTVAQDRYHFPSVPFIAALAGLAATRWPARARGKFAT